MKAYFKCVCRSREKLLAKELRGQGVEVVVVRNSPAWAKYTRQHGIYFPFMIERGKPKQL